MISMIWAEDSQHGIGKNKSIPWHIAEDMAFFKQQTANKTVVMGRKTFDSIGRPLPKRKNIVLTHEPDSLPENVEVFSELAALKDFVKKSNNDTFIIGGSYLYHEFMDIADEVFITRIDGNYECDVFAPDIAKNGFILSKVREGEADTNQPKYRFEHWISNK